MICLSVVLIKASIHPVRKEAPTDSQSVGEFLTVWVGSEAPPKLSNGVHRGVDEYKGQNIVRLNSILDEHALCLVLVNASINRC